MAQVEKGWLLCKGDKAVLVSSVRYVYRVWPPDPPAPQPVGPMTGIRTENGQDYGVPEDYDEVMKVIINAMV